MRNLSLETVQFTHKIKWTADKTVQCATSVHAPFWCIFAYLHQVCASRTAMPRALRAACQPDKDEDPS
jgi:uncharacterized membrane protein YhdT